MKKKRNFLVLATIVKMSFLYDNDSCHLPDSHSRSVKVVVVDGIMVCVAFVCVVHDREIFYQTATKNVKCCL